MASCIPYSLVSQWRLPQSRFHAVFRQLKARHMYLPDAQVVLLFLFPLFNCSPGFHHVSKTLTMCKTLNIWVQIYRNWKLLQWIEQTEFCFLFVSFVCLFSSLHQSSIDRRIARETWITLKQWFWGCWSTAWPYMSQENGPPALIKETYFFMLLNLSKD